MTYWERALLRGVIIGLLFIVADFKTTPFRMLAAGVLISALTDLHE